MISKRLFSTIRIVDTRTIVGGWMAMSLAGFIIAAYLSILHFKGSGLQCIENWDCNAVTAGDYAAMGGIPIALAGAVYYLLIFLMIIAYVDTKRSRILTFVALITLPGFLTSLILIGLQVFVIHATCLYCLLSAVCATGLFALAVIYYKKRQRF